MLVSDLKVNLYSKPTLNISGGGWGGSSSTSGGWGGNSSGGWDEDRGGSGYKDVLEEKDDYKGQGNTWDWDEGVRECHSDNDDPSGRGGAPTQDEGGWADFDNVRNSRPLAQTAMPVATPVVAAPVSKAKKPSQPRKMVDLGAALNYSSSSVPAPAQNAQNDLFSVSDDAPIAGNRSVDLFGNAFQSQPAQNQPAAAPTSGGSFWGEAPVQQNPPQAESQQPDFFAAAPANTQAPAPQVDLFASLSNNPTPAYNSSNPPPGSGRL